MFQLVRDILGDVRRDGQYYSLKSFIKPDDPTVVKIASILSRSKDPIEAAQDFVHKIVEYQLETGEYWRYPSETLEARNGDCDDTTILLISILRNYLSSDSVFAAVGSVNGGGHAWITLDHRIIESTASSAKKVNADDYKPEVLFNDEFAFSTKDDEFGFLLIGKGKYHLRVE